MIVAVLQRILASAAWRTPILKIRHSDGTIFNRGRAMKRDCCEMCGEAVPVFELVSVGSIGTGYRQICARCSSLEIAKLAGLEEFEHVRFEPIDLTDCEGEPHRLFFRMRLCGDVLALDAFELFLGYPCGYQFQVLGNPSTDAFALLATLLEKARRALSLTHLDSSNRELQIKDKIVRGRIEWDEANEGAVPLAIIDRSEVSWDELGRMLMSFEGWQFKLELTDPSGEV